MLAACTQWLESVTQATQISTDFQMQRKLKRDALSLLSWWTKTMVTHHVWVRFFGISVESLSWIVLFQSTEIQSIFFGLNLRNKLISPKLIFSTFSFFGRDFKRTSRLLLDSSDDDNVRFFLMLKETFEYFQFLEKCEMKFVDIFILRWIFALIIFDVPSNVFNWLYRFRIFALLLWFFHDGFTFVVISVVALQWVFFLRVFFWYVYLDRLSF